MGFGIKPKLHPPERKVGTWGWEWRVLQSRRVSSLEEVGCAFGSDGNVVLVIKEQQSRLAFYLGEDGSAIVEMVRGKEDKSCILFGKGGFCSSKQVQVDWKLIFSIETHFQAQGYV